ncbi:hypothetical protein D3C74_99510 [compost metagenome]
MPWRLWYNFTIKLVIFGSGLDLKGEKAMGLYEESNYDAQGILGKIRDYYSQENISFLAKTTLKLYENSIKEKLSINSLSKHDFIFIGKTRVGKSTNICSIFDFYFLDGNRQEQMLPSDKGGTTTPCTIEIDNTDGETYIEIFNIDSRLLEKYINAFIQKEKDKDKGESIPEEIRTIIKRKIGKDKLNEIINSSNTEEISDPFVQEIVKNYQSKDSIQLNYFDEDKNANSVFKWIKTTIDQVRRAQVENVFIPYKMIVHISRSTRELPNWINKIVDTRGISTTGSKEEDTENSVIRAREELTEYIREKNSIVVFLTEYADLDNNIIEYYKELLTSVNTDIWTLSRHMVLISTLPGMVDSKIIDESESSIESNIDELREEVIKEKLQGFEGSMLDFVNRLENSGNDRDRKSLDLFLELKEKCSQYPRLELVDIVLYEAKRYTEEESEICDRREEKIKLNRDAIQERLGNKIAQIHRTLENEITEMCDLAFSIINSKAEKNNINNKLEYILAEFKEKIQNDTEQSIHNYISKYTLRFLNDSSYFTGMTWKAYTNSSGYVISRDGNIVGDTTRSRNEIIEDFSREVTMILRAASQILESNMKDLIKEDDLESLFEAIEGDLINRAKTDLVNTLEKQFEIELKARILNNDLLWESVLLIRQKSDNKYSVIGKKVINDYLDSDFLISGMDYKKYAESNFDKAKKEVKERLLGSLAW